MSEDVKKYHDIYKSMSPEEKEKECEVLFKDLDSEQVMRIMRRNDEDAFMVSFKEISQEKDFIIPSHASRQRAKIEKPMAYCDDDEAFLYMTQEKTNKLIKEIEQKLLDSPFISDEDVRKYSNAYNDHSVFRFPLSSSSTLFIQGGDISQWFIDGTTDAIVSPSNETLLGGGGAHEAIHRAAGPDLARACQDVPEVRPGVRCPTGEARITGGFLLPASHVIHTLCPISNVDINPAASIASAYRYPYDEAVAVAISTIREFQNDFKEVHFIHLKPDIYDIW
ncbi:hypothetical protein TSUD_10520, partial [Trifolium subterraneum]